MHFNWFVVLNWVYRLEYVIRREHSVWFSYNWFYLHTKSLLMVDILYSGNSTPFLLYTACLYFKYNPFVFYDACHLPCVFFFYLLSTLNPKPVVHCLSVVICIVSGMLLTVWFVNALNLKPINELYIDNHMKSTRKHLYFTTHTTNIPI